MTDQKLTHIDDKGDVRMVDVSQKADTERVAVAEGSILMHPETLALIVEGKAAKGKARNARRAMFCQHHACWDAKNRWGLPEKVPMDYSSIAAHIPDMRGGATTVLLRVWGR